LVGRTGGIFELIDVIEPNIGPSGAEKRARRQEIDIPSARKLDSKNEKVGGVDGEVPRKQMLYRKTHLLAVRRGEPRISPVNRGHYANQGSGQPAASGQLEDSGGAVPLDHLLKRIQAIFLQHRIEAGKYVAIKEETIARANDPAGRDLVVTATLKQNGSSCVFAVTPSQISIGVTGGNIGVNLSSFPPGCSSFVWSPTWISVPDNATQSPG